MEDSTTGIIEFDVQMNAGLLYDYSLYHVYRSPVGVLGCVMGMLLLANFARTHSFIYLIFGIIVLVYLPVTLFMNCKRQMLLVEAYKSPLHYRVSDEGIEISQGEITQGHKWDQVIRVTATAKSIFLYTGKNVATIFPREALGEKTGAVMAVISRCVEPGRVKIRF